MEKPSEVEVEKPSEVEVEKPSEVEVEKPPEFAEVEFTGLTTRRDQLTVKGANKDKNKSGKGKGRGKGKKVQDENEEDEGEGTGEGDENAGEGEGEGGNEGQEVEATAKGRRTAAKSRPKAAAKPKAKSKPKAKPRARASGSRASGSGKVRSLQDDGSGADAEHVEGSPKESAPAAKTRKRKASTPDSGDTPEAEPTAAVPKTSRCKKHHDNAPEDKKDASAPGPGAPVPKAATRKRKNQVEEEGNDGESGNLGGESESAKPAPKRKAKAAPKSNARSRKPEEPASDLPDPETWRAEAIESCLQCLKDCQACGTLGMKEKHNHNHAQIDVQDDLSNSIHWKGSRAGTRFKGGSQICYFARETPCNGTNVALVSIWVLWPQD